MRRGGGMRAAGPRLAKAAAARLPPPPKQVDASYRDPAHDRWANAVRRRAGGRCERCGREGTRLFADHVVELRDGGAPFDPANGQALCGSCHSAKTARARAARHGQAGA